MTSDKSIGRAEAMRRSKRLVGYSRISTTAQDLQRQRQALKAYGCKLIFEDTASGKSLAGRYELAKAFDELRPGDCLVWAEWDRATRSMWDGLHIVKQVLDAGATIKVLDFPSLDLTILEGRGFLAVFGNGRTRAIADRGAHQGRPSYRHDQWRENGATSQADGATSASWRQSGWRAVRAPGTLRAISTSATIRLPGCGESL
jgi:hypothetical protein